MSGAVNPGASALAAIKARCQLIWVDGKPRFQSTIPAGSDSRGGLKTYPQLYGSVRHYPKCDVSYRILSFGFEGQEIKIREHHLVWYFVYGEWPDLEIDHRDRDGLNNHPDNLRQATPSQNKINQKLRVDNTSGVRGLRFSVRDEPSPWVTSVRADGVRRQKGFKTKDEALIHLAAEQARMHGAFART